MPQRSEKFEERGLWAVLARVVKGRDAKAFTACVELAGGFVGADLSLLVVEPRQRRWLEKLLGPGVGLFGDPEAEGALEALRPLTALVTVNDTAQLPRLSGDSSIRALIAMPLLGVDGERLGELVFAQREPRDFVPEDHALLQAAAAFLQRHLEVVLLSIRFAVASRRLDTDRSEFEAGRKATDLLVHDLKNPLSVIMLSAESARASVDPNVPALMNDIIESTEIAQRLVNDMLDIRTDGGMLRMSHDRVDLRALVEHLLSRVGVVAEQRHQLLALQCSALEPIVDGDAFLLERLLRNLLDNAFKYAPASSTITVSIAERNGGYVVRVEDEGRLIDSALRAAIFEQDTRIVSTARGSHGLGLKLCKVVADLHDGKLDVEPTNRGGNAFALELHRA